MKRLIQFSGVLIILISISCSNYRSDNVSEDNSQSDEVQINNAKFFNHSGGMKSLINMEKLSAGRYQILGERKGQNLLQGGSNLLRPSFDFDGDGIIDYLKINSTVTNQVCDDGKNVNSRSISIISGFNRNQLLYKSKSMLDRCVVVNGDRTKLIVRLHFGAVHFGSQPGELVLSPQYFSKGLIINDGVEHEFYNPETSAFDIYNEARPMLQPSAVGKTYHNNAQPLNGLVIQHNGESKYLASTSGRFLLYDLNSYTSSQLFLDVPFLARLDLVGRTYGLLMHDVDGNQDKAFLISGTGSNDLFTDVENNYGKTSLNGTDLWGGIERHASVVDLEKGSVSQKFISSAHDNNEGNTYRQRVTYPSYALLPSKSAAGSRMIYNVFDGKTWSIHISSSGLSSSQSILKNYYVWDVVKRNGDDVDIIASPIDLENKIMIPDYLTLADKKIGSWRSESYFPKMETHVFRWSRNTEMIGIVKKIEGGIPYLGRAFSHGPTEGNGTGFLYPSLRSYDQKSDKILLLMYSPEGKTFEAEYPKN